MIYYCVDSHWSCNLLTTVVTVNPCGILNSKNIPIKLLLTVLLESIGEAMKLFTGIFWNVSILMFAQLFTD